MSELSSSVALHHLLDVFRDQVGFQVDRISGLQGMQIRHLHRCGMMAMVQRFLSSFATVRLMPSIEIDPL